MKDPVRLLEQGATREELALLRAGAAEEPGIESRQRLAAALGLGVSVWSSGAAAAASKAAGNPAVKVYAAKWGVKWLVALAGTVTIGGATLIAVLSQESKPAAPAQVTVTRAAPTVEARTPAPTAEAAPEDPATGAEATGLDPEALPLEKTASAPAHKAADAPEARSIAAEIDAVDEIRKLVASGKSQAALSALAGYKKEFPRGVLRQEATLLSIEALAKSGNLAKAREIGQRFLREHPRTPHENRVRALMGDGR